MKHLSLCSGIGGLDLAAEWAGFETAAQCEIDEYASKVLAKNFPGVPNLHDIRTVTNGRLADFGIAAAEITVVSAGFPCQPYSLAGKGRGDRDERDLWGEVARVVGEVRPRWFVGENTPGLFTRSNQRYFRRVLDDLAALGYTVGWGIWGACDVGAPHKRNRVFILAHAYGARRRANAASEQRACEPLDQKRRGDESCRTDRISGDVPDTYRSGQQERRLQRVASVQPAQVHSAVSYADCDGEQQQEGKQPKGGRRSCDSGWWEAEPDVGGGLNGISDRLDKIRGLSNGTKNRARKILFELWQEIGEETIQREIRGYGSIQFSEILLSVLCKYASKCNESGVALESGTVTKGKMRDLWEQIKSSCASCGRGYQQQYAGEYPNALCILSCEAPSHYAKAWEDGSWESGIERVSINCRHRVDRLRCLGNAVVPQQAYPIFEAIADYEQGERKDD